MGKVAKKAQVRRAPPKRAKVYRIVLATYLSEHDSEAAARAALKKVQLRGDDITFILEEERK